MGEFVLEILKEYQGIIGTLTGIITTTVLNRIIKTRGKISIYTDNFNLEKLLDEDKSYDNSDVWDAFKYKYTFDLQIYNNSEEIKFIKNLKVNIYYKNQKEHTESQPLYYDKNKHYKNFDNIKALNLKPKEIYCVEVTGDFMNLCNEEELNKRLERITLTYIDDKNKHKEIIIKDYIKTS